LSINGAGSTEVAQLVARAREGDRTAFDGLVERYSGRIYNIALRITGSREEAEDCAQEAFVRAFASLPRFRGEAAFSTWLYRIAINAANDAARRASSRPLLSSETGGGNPGSGQDSLEETVSPDSAGSPEQELVKSQRREIILQAIRSLTEGHRTVIVLYDLQGLSYDEIARIVGVRVGTVKSRLNRARLALRALLEPYMELLQT
jgi:RNA polymerase sigma-70 factor (ECF subfamily)